jgi:thiol-disulfide isomerase/thioredoxin
LKKSELQDCHEMKSRENYTFCGANGSNRARAHRGSVSLTFTFTHTSSSSFLLYYFRIVADLALDRNDDPRVRLNFNITMMDLKCEFAVVDVVSVLGTDQNVTAHIIKWQIDAGGIRRRYQGRNKQQKDIALFDEDVTDTIEELHEDGEDAISLDAQTFEFIRRQNTYVFVDFYATWCSHCKALAPTWETLAEVMDDVAGDNVKGHEDDYTPEEFEEAKKLVQPVVIAKVDCVTHPGVCSQLENNIRAYPTLRLFVDGEPWKGGDYRGPRTLLGMVEWLQIVEDMHKEEMGEVEQTRTLHTVHEGMLKPRRSKI